jgi:hypothetical protein
VGFGSNQIYSDHFSGSAVELAGIEWDGGNRILTLTNVILETTNSSIISLQDGGTIVLIGTNNLRSDFNDLGRPDSVAIDSTGDLYIEGSGSLRVTSGIATDSFGIFVTGDLTISGATVTATGGSYTEYDSFGIYVKNGDLTINGGANVTANGGISSINSYGIFVGDMDAPLSIIRNMTIHNANVIANSGNAFTGDSYGIFADSLDITGANVTAKSGNADNAISAGIFVTDSLTISVSTVDAKSGNAYYASAGISAEYISIGNNTTVTANGGNATAVSGYSFGITVLYDLTISGATVEATGGDAGDRSYGIRVASGTLTIGGATTKVKAIGGEGLDSYGIYVESDNLVIQNGADVTAKGGNANDNSYGIYVYGNLTIEGSATVDAYGGNIENGVSYGIFVDIGNLTIGGGATVDAYGGTATAGAGNSTGIALSGGGSLSITGATVTANGGDAEISSYGIHVGTGNLTIEGGATVEAYGGTATADNSTGITLQGLGTLSINGADLTARGGDATSNSYGIRVDSGNITINSGAKVIATGGTLGGTQSIGVRSGTFDHTSGDVTMSGNTRAVYNTATPNGLPVEAPATIQDGITGTPTDVVLFHLVDLSYTWVRIIKP